MKLVVLPILNLTKNMEDALEYTSHTSEYLTL